MHKLIVQNFGPIDQCEFELKDFSILIGPQSSGKSTVSKLVFYFLNIRDEFVNFILDNIDSQEDSLNINSFYKQLRRRFVEFWGPTPPKTNIYIKYEYKKNVWVDIRLDSHKHKFLNANFSDLIFAEINRCYQTTKNQMSHAGIENQAKLFATTNNLYSERSRGKIIEELRIAAKELFNIDRELLFIPAGRSLLSTLSDQLQFIHPHQLDYPMRTFIERINLTKSFFGKGIEEIIQEKRALETRAVWFSVVRKVNSLIKKILNGVYIHDKDGGKLYVDKKTYTKINFASSGQQESIWILLSLFLVALDKINALVFIEEPEAHLFPVAQKQIVELMCFLSTSLNTKFVITTHSPYILSAINNYIYASELSKKHKEKVSSVLPEETWLNKEKVNGYFVSEGKLNNLYDNELNMLKAELIDSASDLVNAEYDKLFEIECEGSDEN